MPMNSQEFSTYLHRLNLPALGSEYIRLSRDSPPARAVRATTMRNTLWRYPSRLMGCAMAFESDKEHGYGVQLEYQSDVVEYWEQPPSVQLIVIDKRGCKRRVNYTADFLVLRKDGAPVVQVKTEADCQDLAMRYPNRWAWDGEHACDKAAKRYFAALGLDHVVHVVTEDHKVRVENLTILLMARETVVPHCEMKALAKAVIKLGKESVYTLEHLRRTAGLTSVSAILRLLDQGELFTDLNRCRVSVPGECFLASVQEAVSQHFAAYDAVNKDTGPWDHLSHAELLETNRRLEALHDHATTVSERTMRRWATAFRRAGSEVLALRPMHRRKGNRTARISSREEEFCANSIKQYYLTHTSMSANSAHGQYLQDYRTALVSGDLPEGSEALSYPSFLRRCKNIAPEDAAAARGGRRAANAAAPPVDPACRSLTATQAFFRAHIDHNLCDIFLVVAVTPAGVLIVRRPYLTAMRDEGTGTILATVLRFNVPNRESCLLVIRDCVRRHGKLPATIVVDNGADFLSTYFDVTIARLGVTKQTRPPEAPRFGSSIEAWFHTAKAFIVKHEGNTINSKKGRATSPSHRGEQHARLTLQEFYENFEEFVFDHYNNSHPVDSFESRSSLLRTSMESFPFMGRAAAFNDKFLAETALPLEQKLKVDSARGIRHLGLWYSHPMLFQHRLDGKWVEVYIEPWDKNRIYAHVNGQVVICHHGPIRRLDLAKSFLPALESIKHYECPDVRAQLAQEAKIAEAALVRKAQQAQSSTLPRSSLETKPKRKAMPFPPDALNVRSYDQE